MRLRRKMVFAGLLQLAVVAGVLTVAYHRQARDRVTTPHVLTVRAAVLTAKAARQGMAQAWEQGVFSAEQLAQGAREAPAGQQTMLGAVPVVKARWAAMIKPEERGNTFHVPKFNPRNPKITADEHEAAGVPKMEREGLGATYEMNRQANRSAATVRSLPHVRATAEGASPAG